MLLAAVPACRRAGDASSDSVLPVHLALAIRSADTGTKASVSDITEIQETPEFRGLTDIKLISFLKSGVIEGTDRAYSRPLSLPGFVDLSPYTTSHLYSSGIDAWLPTGASSMLLYGRAPSQDGDAEALHRYGSLSLIGFDTGDSKPLASSFGFAPQVMFSGESTPEAAEIIRQTLSDIVLGNTTNIQCTYGPTHKHITVNVGWNDKIEESALRELFLQITNEGAVVSGSGPLVEAMLTSLYRTLSNYQSYNQNVYEVAENGVYYEVEKNSSGDKLLYKDIYNTLRDILLIRIRNYQGLVVNETDLSVRFANEDARIYPENLGLPSGCASLRWTSAGFIIPEMGGVEGLAPMDRYCFPPSLYYYTNTTIKTSQKDNIKSSYDTGTSWASILNDYELGTSVTSNTRSIALVEPARFGVGVIKVKVQAAKSRLQDNDGLVETTVSATGENLPVTGIIVGGQYAQSFEFMPKEGEDEYFLYDNQVSGVFLTTDESAPAYTLSLQTPDNTDCYFCLELQNNTGETFYGADGRILPGRKFYLVGKLELPTSRAFDSVVVKGHITKVTCIIHSLDGAYNCVPDIGRPQLVLGVKTLVDWTLSTPTTVMLE